MTDPKRIGENCMAFDCAQEAMAGMHFCVAHGGTLAETAIREQLLTDALDFIEANEWGGWIVSGNGPTCACLDCGAPKGTQHSERCAWLGLMRRSGRR